VAAAVSSLFALRLESAGDVDAYLLVPLTFSIIIGTVVIQSLTAGWLASRLGLSSRGEQGVFLVGSNKVALAIGAALHEQGIRVKVADTNRSGLHEARMLGLGTFYGNPLSEHAELYMDLTGYTHLLAVTRHTEFNAVVCAQFRHEFGSKRVYAVQSGGEEQDEGRLGLSPNLRFNRLFPSGMSWSKLSELLAKGGQIKATQLTEEFDYEAFKATWGEHALALFALTGEGKLLVRKAERPLEAQPGWTLISLVPAEALENLPDDDEEPAIRVEGGDQGQGADETGE
jgi:hypothetical protein